MPTPPLQRRPKKKRTGIVERPDSKDVIITDSSTSEGSDVQDIPALTEVITPEVRNEQEVSTFYFHINICRPISRCSLAQLVGLAYSTEFDRILSDLT